MKPINNNLDPVLSSDPTQTTPTPPPVQVTKVNHTLPALFLGAALMGLYFLSIFVKPGWVTFAFSALALIVIVITALARVNDIHIELSGARWHIRRFGLVLAGVGACALLGTSIATEVFPTWREVMLEMGMALTWFTTPHMPPWWKYIAGKDA